MDFLLEIVYTLTESLVLFLFLARIFETPGESLFKAGAAVALHTSCVTLFNLLDGTFSGGMMYYPFMMLAAIFLYNWALRKSMIAVAVFTLFGMVFSLLCDLLTMIVISSVIGEESSIVFKSGIFRTAGALSSRMLFVLLAVMIAGGYLKKASGIFEAAGKRYNFLVIFVLSMLTLLILSDINFYKHAAVAEGNAGWHVAVISAGIVAFSLFVAAVIARLLDLTRKEIEWKQKEAILIRQEEELISRKETVRALKAQRRRLRQHAGCLYGLLQNGKTEEAKEYILEKMHGYKKISGKKREGKT